MTSTNRQIAEAFSSHRFDEALPVVADDAEWMLVGEALLSGAGAIAEACRSTQRELADTRTRFTRFDVADGGDLVAVDAVGVYTDAAGAVTSVASCDLLSFRDGWITGIRSYTVEVPVEADSTP